MEALARGESLRFFFEDRLREVLSVSSIEHNFNWEMRKEWSRIRQGLINHVSKVCVHRM